jgi:hypothetical protein
MSTTVYALSGATPTLWAFPSQQHPATQQDSGGGLARGHYLPPTRRPLLIKPRPLDDDETALAVLAAI